MSTICAFPRAINTLAVLPPLSGFYRSFLHRPHQLSLVPIERAAKSPAAAWLSHDGTGLAGVRGESGKKSRVARILSRVWVGVT